MVQLEIYLREIIYFLRTVTIKNTYFSDQMIQTSVKDEFKDSIPEELNPYYVNLSGEYILKDGTSYVFGTPVSNRKLYTRFNEMMYVISLDTLEQIEFTKENLAAHPRTAALYKIPSNYYFSLCEKYPLQVDLIKAIIYPIPSKAEAIEADNLTLLHYDATVLSGNERGSLISAMLSTLVHLKRRWDVKEFVYEELYAAAHQGLIWYILYSALFTQRITNIRTNNVHHYHIWEYLQSKGLKDYRDVLSTKQQLFLYRNMNYLLKNKGTTNNLSILIDNLLSEYNIDLQAKQLIQQSSTMRTDCNITPTIVSTKAGGQTESDLQELLNGTQESLDSVFNKEKLNKLEPENEFLYNKSIKDQKKTFERMPYTYLPTKLLELKKANESKRFNQIYAKFVAESIIYRASQNKLMFSVSFVPPEQKNALTLTAKDALALLLYSIAKEQGMEYISPPDVVYVEWPFKSEFPEMNEYFKYHKTTYKVQQYLSSTGFSKMKDYTAPFATAMEMSNGINDQAMCFLEQYIEWSRDAESKHEEILVQVYNERLYKGTVSLDLLNGHTYDSWFRTEEYLNSIITQMNSSIDIPVAYAALSTAILDAFFPYASPYLEESSTMDTTRYIKLRQLLISLCSYNITFLDASVGSASLTISNFKTTFGNAGSEYQYVDYTLDSDWKMNASKEVIQDFKTCLDMHISDNNAIESTQIDNWDIITESKVESEIVQSYYVIEELYKTTNEDL